MTALPAHVETQKDVPFMPFRVPRSDRARALVAAVQADLEATEQRRRRRRGADQERFAQAVSAVVSDLSHAFLKGDGPVAITRSRQVLTSRSRYRPAYYGETFPALLDRLGPGGTGWITQDLGYNGFGGVGGKRTTIYASERLGEEILQRGLSLSDFGTGPGPEVIILKRATTDYWDEAEPIEYDDTPETVALRRDIARINRRLAAANISVAEDPEKPVDPLQRQLRRIFTRNSFSSGGRLFGGFWMPMASDDRLRRITIGGERVVELDYGQLAPRVMYGMAGVQPPQGDLYAIPGLEAYRQGVKTFFNAMLFREAPMDRKPKGTAEDLPYGLPASEIVRIVQEAHPAIADGFFKGLGHVVQRTESDLMVTVVKDLGKKGITALPVHDAVVVAASAGEKAMKVMSEAFYRATGVPAVVEKVEG